MTQNSVVKLLIGYIIIIDIDKDVFDMNFTFFLIHGGYITYVIFYVKYTSNYFTRQVDK